MQEPTNTDAVLGGESQQVTSAVLGGIENARRRLANAQTFCDRAEAVVLLSQYNREEAELAAINSEKVRFYEISCPKVYQAFSELFFSAYEKIKPSISESELIEILIKSQKLLDETSRHRFWVNFFGIEIGVAALGTWRGFFISKEKVSKVPWARLNVEVDPNSVAVILRRKYFK